MPLFSEVTEQAYELYHGLKRALPVVENHHFSFPVQDTTSQNFKTSESGR